MLQGIIVEFASYHGTLRFETTHIFPDAALCQAAGWLADYVKNPADWWLLP